MPKPKIRRAQPRDAEAICEMIKKLALHKKIDTGSDPSVRNLRYELQLGLHTRLFSYVADVRGTLVGYAICYPVFSTMHTHWLLFLEDLFVEEAWRGQGEEVDPRPAQ